MKEKTTSMQKVFIGAGIIGVMYIAINTNTADGKWNFTKFSDYRFDFDGYKNDWSKLYRHNEK